MTCTEFQDNLPEMIEGKAAGAHAAHLKACPACADLVSDLKAISEGAKVLCSADEPSPRVWANIQRALEAEGLVHAPRQAGGVLLPRRTPRVAAWLIPVAALVLAGFGILLYQNLATPNQVARETPLSATAPIIATQPASAPLTLAADDQELLARMSPSSRETYATTLKDVDAFIQDAQQSLARNPNDDEARHFLMDAYQQKAMIYELAMERMQ